MSTWSYKTEVKIHQTCLTQNVTSSENKEVKVTILPKPGPDKDVPDSGRSQWHCSEWFPAFFVEGLLNVNQI